MFNKLRTDRQLGYIVSMGSAGYGPVKGMKSMRGFTARILSNRYSPPVMQRELEIFLREMEGRIMALSTEEVEQRSEAIIASLLDPPTSYKEEADEYWGAILDERGYDWADMVVAELRKLSTRDLQVCYSRWFLNDNAPLSVEEEEVGVDPVAAGGMRSCAVMLYGKGKRASLDQAVFEADSEEGCELSPIARSIFPPFSSYSAAISGEGEEWKGQVGSAISDSGVKSGLFVTSMEGLKTDRALLESFDPPAVTMDGEEECGEDECEIEWDKMP